MPEERDESLKAVRLRYDKANLKSILCSDPVVFDSLRDIPKLIKKIEKLEEELKNVNA